MIDIVVLLCSIIGGTLVGIYAAKRKKQYCLFVCDLNRYLNEFAFNINGAKLLKSEFDKKFANGCSVEFSKYLLSEKHECPYKALSENLNAFMSGLSASSSEQLKYHLQEYSAKFKAVENSVVPQCSKLSATYVKLGFLLGVMAGIVVM